MKRSFGDAAAGGVADPDPFETPMSDGMTGIMFPLEEVAKRAVQVGRMSRKQLSPMADSVGFFDSTSLFLMLYTDGIKSFDFLPLACALVIGVLLKFQGRARV